MIPNKDAIIDFDTLLAATHKWVIDEYHQKEHWEIHDSPARRWETAIEEFPPVPPPIEDELKILLGMTEERYIYSSGIQLHGLLYNGDNLAMLRRKTNNKWRVRIKYDPSDLSRIHVFDSDKNVFIPVPAADQGYTAGLTLWQHVINGRYAHQEIGKNRAIRALHLRALEKFVDEASKSSKDSTTRRKMADRAKDSQQKRKALHLPKR